VDGLEEDTRGALKIVRLDVNAEAGRELGARWRVGFTPTFILFDGAGREIWRGMGRLDPAAVRAALEQP
jgi:thioredoxin-related protein